MGSGEGGAAWEKDCVCFQKNNNKGKQGGYEQDAEYVWYWKDTDESKKEMPREHQGTGIGFGANGWSDVKEGP